MDATCNLLVNRRHAAWPIAGTLVLLIVATSAAAQPFEPASDQWDFLVPDPDVDACCFDFDGDMAPDNAVAEYFDIIRQLSGADPQLAIDAAVAEGSWVRAYHWAQLPAGLADGPVSLDIYGGEFDGLPPSIGDRADGLGSITIDLAGPDGLGPYLFDGTLAGGTVALTGDRFDIVFPLGEAIGLLPISAPRIEGDLVEDAGGCLGVCSAGPNALTLGGIVSADEATAVLDAFYRSECTCRGIDPGSPVFTWGENLTTMSWERSCTANVGSSGQCPDRAYCDALDVECGIGNAVFAALLDVDRDEPPNGILDSLSLGARIQLAGTTIMAPAQEIFADSFED